MDDTSSLPQDVAPSRRTVLQLLGATAGLTTIGATDALAATSDSSNMTDTYKLPDLPYAYDALEPHINEQIMRLHHDEHHQGYVDGANTALGRLAEMRKQNEFDKIKPVKRNLSFNLSGHILHSLFWQSMSPSGGGKPSGALADALADDFGSVDSAMQEFSAAAKNVEDSGWGMLVYDHLAEQLLVTQAEDHNDLAVQGATPLLVLDVWEHAYYLQYTNNRGDYVDAFWNVVNWDTVASRYETVKSSEIFEETC